MMRSTIIIIFLLVFSHTIHSQTFSLGLRTEIIDYFVINNQTNSTGNTALFPASIYMKFGAGYQQFSLDVKGGLQLGYPFFGSEYGATFKYSLTDRISPLIVWLKHFNGSDSHNSGGIYTEPIYFLGFGAEAEFTRVFSMDLTFYIPVGNSKLEYSKGYNGVHNLSTRVGTMIKLGFIFNIVRF